MFTLFTMTTALANPLPMTSFPVAELLGEDPIFMGDRLNGPDVHGVVGGTVVPAGEWEDVAAVVFNNSYVGCTGTLISPTLVLTAAHCASGITDVILDTKDYETNQGESISVSRVYVHPSYNGGGYDAAVLKLSRASTRTPRLIATDCILDAHLRDGADVATVGYGATNTQGTAYGSKLREGFTDIDDADCGGNYADGIFMGCEPSINPGGEIGAGGDGVDACFGDSGGPLYLLTPDGEAYLTGITSRAYAGIDPNYPCRDGGIWVRADAVMDWVEDVTGETLDRPTCNDVPKVTVEDLVVQAGQSKNVEVTVVDDSPSWSATMLQPPAHGTVTVASSGVEYTADEDYEGDDAFTVEISDNGGPYPGSAAQTVTVTVDVTVLPSASSGGETPEFLGGAGNFDPSDSDGAPTTAGQEASYQRVGRACDTASTPAGWLALWLAIPLLRRRNQR